MPRTAPYRHADGSNCWTLGCSKNTGMRFNLVEMDEFFGTETVSPSPALVPTKKKIPVKSKAHTAPKPTKPLVTTGATMNARHVFQNRTDEPYDITRHEAVQNLTGTDYTWTKPSGGFWIGVIEENGRSSWDNLWGDDVPGDNVNTVRFKDDAKVLVIDSWEDYQSILNTYPYYADFAVVPDEDLAFLSGGAMSAITKGGKPKRGMDFEAIAKDHDAIFLTRKGLYACGRGDFMGEKTGDDISLYLWDIPSGLVLNPDAIIVE